MATRRRRRFTADFKKRVGRSKRCGGTGRCRRSPPGTRSIPAAWGSGRTLRCLRSPFTMNNLQSWRRVSVAYSVHNFELDSITLWKTT